MTYEELRDAPVTNREEAIAVLKAAEKINDMEEPHMLVDQTLQKLLCALGYGDVVKVADGLEISWYYA